MQELTKEQIANKEKKQKEYSSKKVHLQRDKISPDLEINSGLDIVDRSANVDRQKLAVTMLKQGDYNEQMRRLMNQEEELTLRESIPNPFARKNISLSQKRDMIDKTNKTIYEVNKLAKERSEANAKSLQDQLVQDATNWQNSQKNIKNIDNVDKAV